MSLFETSVIPMLDEKGVYESLRSRVAVTPPIANVQHHDPHDPHDPHPPRCAFQDPEFRKEYFKLERQKATYDCTIKMLDLHKDHTFYSISDAVKDCKQIFK